MRKHRLAFVAAILLVVSIMVAGCNGDRTKISTILDNPDRYINKDVKIAGTVTKTYGVNLIIAEAGAYQVDDGTGQIWVITKRSLPSEGTKVGLSGTVSGKINILGTAVSAVIQEKDRRTSY